MAPVTIPTLVRAKLTNTCNSLLVLCQDESKDIAVLVDFSSTMYTASTQPATISKGNNQAATACDDDDFEDVHYCLTPTYAWLHIVHNAVVQTAPSTELEGMKELDDETHFGLAWFVKNRLTSYIRSGEYGVVLCCVLLACSNMCRLWLHPFARPSHQPLAHENDRASHTYVSKAHALAVLPTVH